MGGKRRKIQTAPPIQEELPRGDVLDQITITCDLLTKKGSKCPKVSRGGNVCTRNSLKQ